MSNKIVSIVIVTKGTKEYFRALMDSIKNQTFINFEITVIDNSVNRDFRRYLNDTYPGITAYANPKNLFYCAALNKGINLSKGNYILCLNDDVLLDKNFIEEALRGFAVSRKIGLVSGKILRADGQTLDSTGLFLSPMRTAQERSYGKKDTKRFEKEEYIFGVNGAVAFYRREMLEDIKISAEYFDQDFHIFYEDLDIAWRAQNFGWQGYYIPKAIAYHIRGGTVRAKGGINKRCARHYLNDELTLGLIRNRYLTIIKNDKLLNFLSHLPIIIIYELFTYAYLLIFRFALIKKLFDSRILIKSAFRKRQLLKYCFAKHRKSP
jgi:GT2 family glycosyltransferase